MQSAEKTVEYFYDGYKIFSFVYMAWILAFASEICKVFFLEIFLNGENDIAESEYCLPT